MRLCLVEDSAVVNLEPLTLTRPVFELRLGSGTLGSKIARFAGIGQVLDHLFAAARTVKGRRGEPFTSVEEQLYLDLYEQTGLERERAFQRARDRHGESSPLAAVRR